jgi:hypothetical protein
LSAAGTAAARSVPARQARRAPGGILLAAPDRACEDTLFQSKSEGAAMQRFWWAAAVLCVLAAGTGRAKADIIITTDPTKFVSNDSAPWNRGQGNSISYQTTSGMGTFSWNFVANSVPYDYSLVTTFAEALQVGVTSYGTGGTASYVVNASFDFGGRPVTGFGFNLYYVTPATHLTVYDVQGGSHTFTLGASFVGVESDLSLTGFQLSESLTDSSATLGVAPVYFDVVPTPEPSALLLVLAGCCTLGVGFGRRRAGA